MKDNRKWLILRHFCQESRDMSKTKTCDIRIYGLLDGIYDYMFELDRSFLASYATLDIRSLQVLATVKVIKSSSHLDLEIELKGDVDVLCDRCLAKIKMPISSRHDLLIKYASTHRDDGDVIYITRSMPSFDLSKSLYDLVCLSIPTIRKVDCDAMEEVPCDLEVLKRLKSQLETKEHSTEIWDTLREQINIDK